MDLTQSALLDCTAVSLDPGHSDNAYVGRHSAQLFKTRKLCLLCSFSFKPFPCSLFSPLSKMASRQMSSEDRQAELLRTMLSSPSPTRPEKRRRTVDDNSDDDEDFTNQSDWEEFNGNGLASDGSTVLSTPVASTAIATNSPHVQSDLNPQRII
jgi:hypothetical protein